MLKISMYVHPGAKKNEMLRLQDGVWHLKIAAPPVAGKANRELIAFLSERLGVAKSRITIEKGITSRRKLVRIEDVAEEVIKNILTPS